MENTKPKFKWWMALVIILSVLVVDQVTKAIIVSTFKEKAKEELEQLAATDRNETVTEERIREHAKGRYHNNIIGDFLWFEYVENKNVVWGFDVVGKIFGSEMSENKWVRNGIYSLFTLIAIGVVIYFFRNIKAKYIYPKICFAMILGGALGNFTDRLFGHIIYHGKFDFMYGAVVDWISVNFYNIFGIYRWPTFNIADSSIFVAVFMLLGYMLFSREVSIFKERPKKIKTDNTELQTAAIEGDKDNAQG